jgi:hypothetical protein
VEAFHHVLSLLAFVFAVSLTSLLSRMSALFVARDRVTVSGLSVIAGLNCALLVYVNWLAMWELREVPDWNMMTISGIFAFALSIYFTSTLALPQSGGEGPIDLRAFYDRERVTYYVSWLVCELLAIVCNLLLANPRNATELYNENILNGMMLLPILLALAVRQGWAQWTGGLGLMAANLAFLIAFEDRLQ